MYWGIFVVWNSQCVQWNYTCGYSILVTWLYRDVMLILFKIGLYSNDSSQYLPGERHDEWTTRARLTARKHYFEWQWKASQEEAWQSKIDEFYERYVITMQYAKAQERRMQEDQRRDLDGAATRQRSAGSPAKGMERSVPALQAKRQLLTSWGNSREALDLPGSEIWRVFSVGNDLQLVAMTYAGYSPWETIFN